MNHQEEGAPRLAAVEPQQSRRTTTKRNTAHARAHHFLGDTLRVAAALSLALAIMAAGEWLTHQARPIVVLVGAYAFLASLILLIAWRES